MGVQKGNFLLDGSRLSVHDESKYKHLSMYSVSRAEIEFSKNFFDKDFGKVLDASNHPFRLSNLGATRRLVAPALNVAFVKGRSL